MKIKRPLKYATIIDRQGDCGVFDTMEDAIKLAYEASMKYSKYSPSRKSEIIEAVVKKLEDNLEYLTSMACKEAGICSYDDILSKNATVLTNSLSDKYLQARLAARNRNNNEDSYIVNGVITSSVNPIETIIKNTIAILKNGNSVVFSSDKNVRNVFGYAVKLINNAIEEANGPKNLIVTVKEPSMENTNVMIEHENITLISEITNTAEKIAL